VFLHRYHNWQSLFQQIRFDPKRKSRYGRAQRKRLVLFRSRPANPLANHSAILPTYPSPVTSAARAFGELKAGREGWNFPARIRRPFYRSDGVNRSHSTDSPFSPEAAARERRCGCGQRKVRGSGKGGAVGRYRRTGAGPMSADTTGYDPPRPSIPILASPGGRSRPPANPKSH